MLRNDLISRLLGRGGDRHVQRDGLGGPARLGDLRDHGIQGVLAPARNHHRPAVGRQRLGAGLPDPAAPPVTQATRFPFWSCKLSPLLHRGGFANPALGFDRPLTIVAVKPCGRGNLA